MSALLTISGGKGSDGGLLQQLTVPGPRSRLARGVGGHGSGHRHGNGGSCGDTAETAMSEQPWSCSPSNRDVDATGNSRSTTCSLSVQSAMIGGRSTMRRWSIASSCATLTGSQVLDHFAAFFQVSDNKLSMKLFGNRLSLEKEKQRHRAVGHWVIHPCSNFR